MARTVAIGIQNFEKYIESKCFYVDKTKFIGEWWKASDDTTVVMRPRRFGKTLTMDMVKTFFSLEYKDKGEKIFGGLEIWQDEEMKALQGTYPVIFLTFAAVKPNSYENLIAQINSLFRGVYSDYDFLLSSDKVKINTKESLKEINEKMSPNLSIKSINVLCGAIFEHYGKRPIIILDEYDTPMLEAYAKGYWEEAVEFLRGFFNFTFKTNPYLERALMTGITRISKESIFSDFNHVKLVTMLSDKYADCFGFTEEEVFASMDEYGLTEKEKVKHWYNGFKIGNKKDIYNPWSIINFLETNGKYATYWANSSSNGLINRLIREGSVDVKLKMDDLLHDKPIDVYLDDEIIFQNLENDENAMWSMFYASGYLTGECVESLDKNENLEASLYRLHITNFETKAMFRRMVSGWFASVKSNYNDFIKYMLQGNIKAMNTYMNRIALATFSYFDTGKNPSAYNEPERFYHGFVLGLTMDLRGEYIITSNRESGFGRYDVIIEPKDISKHDAIIMEFKVHDSDDEKDLKETVASAIQQINDMDYASGLTEKGIPMERIKKYGFAFEGKKVLIGC